MNIKKYINFDIIFGFVALVAIVVVGILVKQSFIKILPVSLAIFVQYFLSKANRLGYLFNGLNAFVWAVGFWQDKLYGNVVQSIFISGLISIIIFFRWKKKAEGMTTKIKTLPTKWKILVIFATVITAVGITFILKAVGGNNSFFDATTMLLILVASLLSFFAYEDQWFFNIACTVIYLVIYSINFMSDITAITYLIYMTYQLIKMCEGYIQWRAIRKSQEAEIKVE